MKNSPNRSQHASFEEQAQTPAYTVKKSAKILATTSTKHSSRHTRTESTKSLGVVSGFPFENISNTKPFKTKKTPMNYFQRYAHSKAPSDPRPEKNQFTKAAEVRSIQQPIRIHANTNGKSNPSVKSQQLLQSEVSSTKNKQSETHLLAFKPAILNLQIDPKNYEYTGYKTSSRDKNTIFNPKTTSHSTWKHT